MKYVDRLGREGEYLFGEVERLGKEWQREHPNVRLYSLGVGDVRGPMCEAVGKAMSDAILGMARTAPVEADRVGDGAASCGSEGLISATNRQGDCSLDGGDGRKKTTAQAGGGFRGYGPTEGYAFLREAIAGYYRGLGVRMLPDEVFVSHGAKEDLGEWLEMVDGPVVLGDPTYPMYGQACRYFGRNVVRLGGSAEREYLPMAPVGEEKSLRGACVVLCSPLNPTGGVYRKRELTDWVEFVRRVGGVLLYDVAYQSYVQNGVRSVYEVEGAKECAVEIGSFSKSACFTGVRCGWSVVPKSVDGGGLWQAWKSRKAALGNGVGYAVQRGAEAALGMDGLADTKERVRLCRRLAGELRSALERKGFAVVGGVNAPYLWVRHEDYRASWELFGKFLSFGVLVTPGVGFGEQGEGWVRLSVLAGENEAEGALRRIEMGM